MPDLNPQQSGTVYQGLYDPEMLSKIE